MISLSAGQVQHLRLSAPGHAFNPARVLGTFAGTTPGIEEIAGLMPHVHLPLNRDRYFWMTWNGTSPLLANPPGVPTGPFAGFVPLDINGRATTIVSVPPALHSVFVGRTVHHAFVTRSFVPIGFDCASNSIALTFAP